jgi:hypothetical protein
MGRGLLLGSSVAVLLVGPFSSGVVAWGADSPGRVVDAHLDLAPVAALGKDRIWSVRSGGEIQLAGLLALAVSLRPHLAVEGDLGYELQDGRIFGGMLRSPWMVEAVPWVEVSGALGALVIDGTGDHGRVWLIHAEVAAQARLVGHLLLFIAAGPELSLSEQLTTGDDSKFGWKKGDVAVRGRFGVGATW